MAAFTASRGRIEAVSDEQILDAYRLLAVARGRLLRAGLGGLGRRHPRPRPAAAPTAAERRETVVCVLTGHGLKDPDTALGKAPAGDRLRGRPGRGRARDLRLSSAGRAARAACRPATQPSRRRAPRVRPRTTRVDGCARAAAIGLLRDLLAPPRCAIVRGAVRAPRTILCRACARERSRRAPAAASTSLPGHRPRRLGGRRTRATARELVAALKFRGAVGLARVAGGGDREQRCRRALDGCERRRGPGGAAPTPAPGLRPGGADRGRGRVAARPRDRRSAAPRGRPAPGRAAAARERLASPPRIVRAARGSAASAAGRRRAHHRGDARGLRAPRLRAAGCAEVRASVFAHALGDPGAGA